MEIAMDIIVIGPEGSERLAKFQRESGCNVHRLLPGKLNPGQLVQGVVYFDDGKRNLRETLIHEYDLVRFLGVPLIVVASVDRIGEPNRLRAAGANWICVSETSDADILKEIQARCDVHPVDEALRGQLLEPLIAATKVAFSEMAHTEVSVRAAYQKRHCIMLGELVAVLRLKSMSADSLVLDITQRTALSLARRVLSEVAHVTDHAIVYDCMGEIANVIAGQAKALLAETPFRFTFSTPTIHVNNAGNASVSLPGNNCLVVVFASEVGDFALQLGFR
jgi:chemotaxis protein CheX